MPTRRTFLKASSLACAASALHPMLHAQNPATPDPFSNQNLEPGQQGLLTRAAFAAVLQSIFTLTLPDGTTRTLRLVDVSDPPPDDPTSQNFMVSFTVAGGAFQQGTYVMDHATMGSFALFMVPSSTDSSAQSCTAIFNNVDIQVSSLTGVTQGGSLLPATAPAAPTLSTFKPMATAASMSVGTAPAATANSTSNAVPVGEGEVVMVGSASSDFDSSMDVLSDSTTSTDASSCKDSTAKTADSSSATSSSSSASSSSNTSCTTTTASSTTTSTTTPQQ